MDDVERREGVVVIHMKRRNRLTTETMQQLMDTLDSIELWRDVKCVITTGAGKFYSTGLDINTETPLKQNHHQIALDMDLLHKLLARLLTFPVPTIAAISGHAFGGGAFLTLAHDIRIMSKERGWWCVPAVTAGLQVPLPQGLTSLLQAKVPAHSQSQVILAKRFTAEEALTAGIIHEVCSSSDLMQKALETAVKLTGKSTHLQLHRDTLQAIKRQLYHHAYSSLKEGISFKSNL